MTLTENQKEFLLEYFFINQYPGSRDIALLLITIGECIVAGNTCIWQGGIGYFIKTKPAINAVDCLLYTFDIEYFMSSKWYKEIHDKYLSELSMEIEVLSQKFKDIHELK